MIRNAKLDPGDVILSVIGCEFGWTEVPTMPGTGRIDLDVRKGELVGIMGGTGSGKTSLLSAVMGEMIQRKGEVRLCGHIAYASQTPW